MHFFSQSSKIETHKRINQNKTKLGDTVCFQYFSARCCYCGIVSRFILSVLYPFYCNHQVGFFLKQGPWFQDGNLRPRVLASTFYQIGAFLQTELQNRNAQMQPNTKNLGDTVCFQYCSARCSCFCSYCVSLSYCCHCGICEPVHPVCLVSFLLPASRWNFPETGPLVPR